MNRRQLPRVWVVYFISDGHGHMKIGYTSDINTRLSVLQVGNAYDLEVIDLIPCKTRQHAVILESQLHREYQDSHIKGEWYYEYELPY